MKPRKNSTAGAVLSVSPAGEGEQNMGNFGLRIKKRRLEKIPAGLRPTPRRVLASAVSTKVNSDVAMSGHRLDGLLIAVEHIAEDGRHLRRVVGGVAAA